MKSDTHFATTKTTTGHASGKLILIGEHAVVHGQPAIALPFKRLEAKAVVEPTDGPILINCALYRGPLAAAPQSLRGLETCILGTLDALHQPQTGISILLESTIPLGRGLGSSAAVAAAVVRALVAYHCKPSDGVQMNFSHANLMALTHIAEVYAHGTPSGIDSEAVVADGPLWFIKGQSPERVIVHQPFYLVVADSGREGDTHSAVAAVRAQLEAVPNEVMAHILHLGQLANTARMALTLGDALQLGQTLNEAQADLSALGVSDEHLDDLIQAARSSGALGAKLTGSGRGGCVFALARDAQHVHVVADAFTKAGAAAVWPLTIERGGLR